MPPITSRFGCFLLTFLASLAFCAAQNANRPPNIILIVSETDYMTGDGELLARQRHTRIRRPVKK